MAKYIIQATCQRGIVETGFICFDWVRGKRYPEAFCVSTKGYAQPMTERQKDYFEETLQNNGMEYKIIELL